SGRTSFGHRFLQPRPFELGSAPDLIDAYKRELKARFVIVDPRERTDLIVAELARVEAETKRRVRKDAALLAEGANLVESPVAVGGTFDERFLEIPHAVVLSAMRGHQRYFAMTSESGALSSHFVTIAGTVVKDARVVAHGNERVLRARLSDA